MTESSTYGDLIGTATYIPVVRHRGFLLSRPPEAVRRLKAPPLMVEPYSSLPASTKFATEVKTVMMFESCRLNFNGMYEDKIIHHLGKTYHFMQADMISDFPRVQADGSRTSPYHLACVLNLTVEELSELSAWLRLLAQTEGGHPADGWYSQQRRRERRRV